jgi:transposase
VDLGEVHVAAVTTTRQHALVVSGRQLRACKQWRNKVYSVLQEQLSRSQPGSRRTKRVLKRTAQVSAKLYRQQRDLLHQAAHKVVTFYHTEGVTRIAVGDVRDIQTGSASASGRTRRSASGRMSSSPAICARRRRGRAWWSNGLTSRMRRGPVVCVGTSSPPRRGDAAFGVRAVARRSTAT